MSRRKRKRQEGRYVEVELNIMPFIDVFSILTTFLLMTAVFLSIGIHEVQVPFFTSAPKEKPKTNERTLGVQVEVEKTKVILKAEWSPGAAVEVNKEFEVTENGLMQLHAELVKLRVAQPSTDLVSLYSDDDVIYDQLNKVLDAIKVRSESDPVIPVDPQASEEDKQKGLDPGILYPKVVFSSVIL